MALTPGNRIGPYEVSTQIGVGGMGEVYRATDTTLKRQVAIKVLPEALAADADRLARFQREAEVLASLNHPNIAAIHGVEEGPAEAGHYTRQHLDRQDQSRHRDASRPVAAPRSRSATSKPSCPYG